ncbi:MAG: hypothetical protein VZR00_00540 [Lachnospiraceae bacterium]|jgi:hypothetical protein|nr:hypothetical protein [Lachnospiraceae bacterium]MEE3460363.1 hypothetical protein [Lachnospiraceae bacterium]
MEISTDRIVLTQYYGEGDLNSKRSLNAVKNSDSLKLTNDYDYVTDNFG